MMGRERNWKGGNEMSVGLEMDVVCNKDEVLNKIRENRENHIKIMAEARKGYVREAIEFANDSTDYLDNVIHHLGNGDVGVSLTPPRPEFSLPKDHTLAYNTAIQMLELHQDETVVLTGYEVRTLVEDIWDWQQDFLRSAAQYTNSASVYALSKNL